MMPEDINVLLQPRKQVFLEFKSLLREVRLRAEISRRERFRQRGWGGNLSGGNSVAKMQKAELLVCSWGLQPVGVGRRQT